MEPYGLTCAAQCDNTITNAVTITYGGGVNVCLLCYGSSLEEGILVA